ncbi:MAG: T9SS type A sorting domain-containing protein [Ignavibacteriae bacterium]|nr:T9SS type A sorting domain-containing protein [Ignavibacteriota bacterium]MCB9215459.1 T9SS type A sorting domain-containing protein [Ignavibacteria bacterium]
MKTGDLFTNHKMLSLPLLLAMLFLFSGEIEAQERTPQHPKIEQFLNPDGSLRTSGFPSGSVDARGWQVEQSADGELRFRPESTLLPSYARPSAPGDENWDGRFGASLGSSGVDDEIFAMASDGEKLYIGGAFTKAGEISVNNLASWDGAQWARVGPGPGILNGVNGFVNALAVAGDTLFIGGQFDTGATKPIKNIAFYDILTKSWRSMGDVSSSSGIASVSAILVQGDKVYVGGIFDRAGSQTVQNVAVYNRTTSRWSALGSGVDGTVNALAAGPDGIYVGGSFSSAGGVVSSGVARWDGSAWHDLAGGVNGFVNAIAVMDNTVFIAGGFDRAGDTAVNNIARWRPDTATWTRLSGIFWLSAQEPIRLEGNGVNNVVRTLVVKGKELFVGGTFTTAYPEDYTTSNAAVRYVARWNEFDGDPLFNTLWWGRLSEGMDGFVNALEFFDDRLYAAGSFTNAGGVGAGGIAQWNGLRWFSLAKGTGNNLFALDVKEGDVWVGGEFNQPGVGIGTRLANLNGTSWELVPGLFSGSIYTVAIHDEWVYVGGRFAGVSDIASANVVRYNMTTKEWGQLGTSSGATGETENSFVAAITFDGDDVYLGGDFTNVDGMPAYSIVRWNSVADSWEALNRGINGQVFALTLEGDDMYVGGRFLGAGDLLTGPAKDARNVAHVNVRDKTWTPLGEGVNKVVWDITVKGEKVYLGGSFDSAGSLRTPSIVAWNTTAESWETLGEGLVNDFLPSVNSLSVDGETLYAGGSFQRSGIDSMSNIAKWDGSGWTNLGSGVDNYVYVVDVDENKIYVAGAFQQAGGKSSIYFGIYNNPGLSVKERGSREIIQLEESTPNPFSLETTIRFQTSVQGHVRLKVYDPSGREVTQLIDHQLPAGDHRIIWQPDLSLAAGLYVVTLEVDGEILSRKVIKE